MSFSYGLYRFSSLLALFSENALKDIQNDFVCTISNTVNVLLIMSFIEEA